MRQRSALAAREACIALFNRKKVIEEAALVRLASASFEASLAKVRQRLQMATS